MSDKVFLIHGWNVADSRTYGKLNVWLKAEGFQAEDIYLGAYVNQDNYVTIEDLAKAMHKALQEKFADDNYFESVKFNVITHSTGALVARNYLRRVIYEKGRKNPVRHLILTAPPNHGSRLAHHGRSLINRLREGGYVGMNILHDLELGSQLQWELAKFWNAIFGKDLKNEWYEDDDFFFYSLIGSDLNKKWVNNLLSASMENGSDNTVRIPSANLNGRYYSVRKNTVISNDKCVRNAAFRVYPERSHYGAENGIIGSMGSSDNDDRLKDPVFQDIKKILANVTDPASYRNIVTEFNEKTANDHNKLDQAERSKRLGYSQIVFRVRDDVGKVIEDYLIEFRTQTTTDKIDGRSDRSLYDHRKARKHVHKNTRHPNYLIYYLKPREVTLEEGRSLIMIVDGTSPSPNIDFEDIIVAFSNIDVHKAIPENETTYIDVTLSRTDGGKNRPLMKFYPDGNINPSDDQYIHWGGKNLNKVKVKPR